MSLLPSTPPAWHASDPALLAAVIKYGPHCPCCLGPVHPSRCGEPCERCEALGSRAPLDCTDEEGHSWAPSPDGIGEDCTTCEGWRIGRRGA